MRKILGLSVATCLLLAGCSIGSSGGSSNTSHPVGWQQCDGGECATLKVPLDYAKPKGQQINLALFRIPATDPSQRVGSLLVDPGGPGEPGTDFLRAFASRLPSEVQQKFDVVAWDPRGTGKSTRVECDLSLDYLFDGVDYMTTNPAGLDNVFRVNDKFARDCKAKSGNLLAHVGTIDSARDMDRIRGALGDSKLNYLGYSYGTTLGAEYAKLFTQKIRAMVLDGAVDPSLSSEQSSIQQSKGFELALQDFFNWCGADRSCKFWNHGDPGAAFDKLAAEIEANPLPVKSPEGRVLGPTQFNLGTALLLYGGRLSWPTLADSLAAVQKGDGAELLNAFDQYVGRNSDGTYDNSYESFLSINCVDSTSLDRNGFIKLGDDSAAAAPRFGRASALLGAACKDWPVHDLLPPEAIHAKGAPPILVIGTTGDPATPVEWARALASQLDSGHLLIYNGEGHTAFVTASNTCINNDVVAYLVNLTVSPNGAECSSN